LFQFVFSAKSADKHWGKMKDKVVVITGGAGGIGAALGSCFGREGSRIALLDVDGEELKAGEQKLLAMGVDVLAWTCDITSEEDCNQAIQAILHRFGGIDVLINNAGVTQISLFRDTPVSVLRRVVEVNFFGSLHCTKAALGSLIERKGIIIVISSTAGVAPLMGRTGYSASKHALHGLFESLRTELIAQGVHVMMVCPGFTRTQLQSRALHRTKNQSAQEADWVGKQAAPEEVAQAIYRGALKRKRLLILTPVGKLSYYLNKFAPALYERMMARKLGRKFGVNASKET
jgi:NAD(P)-dependent dehydrogenase (short-subunit alcohol dehydrogenase family)